jgi:hypothetical protein
VATTPHSTKFHSAWAKNPASFKLSANHMYDREKKRIGQGGPPVYLPPSAPAPPSTSAGGTAGVISFTRAELEAKLAAVERTSTNPNASEMSEYFRSVFLN